ncbi:uncharacterized protein DUF4129 [Melghirimyces profundicolus]|uniref:Uncharacterized protein DUF4129 n=1 Tax=Melghirimyces profundicolus TaxID=1242148 RepID=A0A2T6AZU3_9BACL|nr:transglutaminase domain-containing protein [Melghirimyces profundicolus]PTX49344.1 uncharacterized protein DUF4129 [Melghirimyces profundicolus]
MAVARPDRSRPPLSAGARVGLVFFGALTGLECLLPLSEVSDTQRIGVFFTAFLVFLATNFVHLNRWITGAVRLFLLPIFLHQLLYHPIPLTDSDWIGPLAARMKSEVSRWMTEGRFSASPVLQTLALLMLLWAIASVFRRLAERGKGVLALFLLAVFHLSVLDSLTPYDGSGAIIRVFIYGCVALSFLRLSSLRAVSSEDPPEPRGWIPFSLAFILLAVGVGWMLPKPAASWPDPLKWVTSLDDRAGPGGAAKIGYGNNDSRLGGPFEQDRDPVLTAILDKPWYWRGEARDLYTGKGWQSTLKAEPVSPAGRRPDKGADHLPPSLFREIPVRKSVAHLFWNREYPVLFTPGQLRSYHIQNPPNPGLEGVVGHGGFTTRGNVRLSRYTVSVEVPEMDKNKLRGTGSSYPSEVSRIYLQLPEDFPERVAEKAEELTRNEDNPYDKAVAVESWLKGESGLRYETQDVPVPGRNQDFADQFLFESKRGYCDHFSSSMVVMMRSVGIPARWVKGFGPGEQKLIHTEASDERGRAAPRYQMTVRNSDAHSWVEVYFEGVGWLPFEPTPGFTNPTPVKEEIDSDPVVSAEEENGTDTKPDPRLERSERELGGRAGPPNEAAAPETTTIRKTRFLWAAGTAGLLLWMLWLFRKRIAWWLLWRYTRGDRGLTRAFHALLKWLSRTRGPRRPGETVREYVLERDWMTRPSPELIRLTRSYEDARYGNGNPTSDPSSLRRLWRKVLEQLRS